MTVFNLEILISQLVYKMATNFQRLRGPAASTAKLVWELFDVRVNAKSKMAAITGSTYEKNAISQLLYKNNSNEIPKTSPTLSRSANSAELVSTLSDVGLKAW